MNLIIIIIVGLAVLELVVFLIIRNKKDEIVFEDNFNNDYTKKRDEPGNHRTDDLTDSVH